MPRPNRRKQKPKTVQSASPVVKKPNQDNICENPDVANCFDKEVYLFRGNGENYKDNFKRATECTAAFVSAVLGAGTFKKSVDDEFRDTIFQNSDMDAETAKKLSSKDYINAPDPTLMFAGDVYLHKWHQFVNRHVINAKYYSQLPIPLWSYTFLTFWKIIDEDSKQVDGNKIVRFGSKEFPDTAFKLPKTDVVPKLLNRLCDIGYEEYQKEDANFKLREIRGDYSEVVLAGDDDSLIAMMKICSEMDDDVIEAADAFNLRGYITTMTYVLNMYYKINSHPWEKEKEYREGTFIRKMFKIQSAKNIFCKN